MAIFNWIQARFAHGTDHVTDAPDPMAEAIARAVRDRSQRRNDRDFGVLALGRADLTCIYLRVSRSPGGLPFVHAVAWEGDATDLDVEAVERIFACRYGESPQRRARELMTRIASVSAAEATLPLAEHFVEAGDLGLPAKKKEPRRRRPLLGLRDRVGAKVGRWVGAAAVVVCAGFYAASSPLDGLASVDAPPPGLELERRIARLEADRNVPDNSMRIQLLHERQRHEQVLADKDREIAELTRRLERTWTHEEAGTSIASVPLTSSEGEPERTELPISEPIAVPPVADAAPTVEPITQSSVDSTAEPTITAAAAPTIAEAAEPTLDIAAAPTIDWLELPAVEGIPEPTAKIARVTADLLWVRSEPGVQYPKVDALGGDSFVEVEGGLEGPWARITSPTVGWVASEFLELDQ